MVWHHGLYHFPGIVLPVHDLASCMGVARLVARLLALGSNPDILKNTKMVNISKEGANSL
jgi:hypothetical protein